MFKDLVIKNRTYRGWDPSRKVTREELVEMIDCARLSAASVNLQPLKYHIILDEEEVAVTQKLTKLARALQHLNLPFPGTEPPAYIAILHDTSIHPDTKSIMFHKDVGITAQSITLCAAEMDLNCCMIGNFNHDELHAALGLDDLYHIQLVIAVGKGAEEIHLVDINEGDSHNYYRDENNVHYTPKRKLEDVIV